MIAAPSTRVKTLTSAKRPNERRIVVLSRWAKAQLRWPRKATDIETRVAKVLEVTAPTSRCP